MESLLAHLTAPWASMFANSAALRTAVGFAHVGGLVASAGRAVVMDSAVLRASASERARAAALSSLAASHRLIASGLAVVILSGLLLFAADVETYFESLAFWTKMLGIVLLSVNGVVMMRATRAAERGEPPAWVRLRRTAMVSLVLWTLTTLIGAALPNV
jgi:hypothetical protein